MSQCTECRDPINTGTWNDNTQTIPGTEITCAEIQECIPATTNTLTFSSQTNTITSTVNGTAANVAIPTGNLTSSQSYVVVANGNNKLLGGNATVSVSPMVGANGTVAGVAGVVPAPEATDNIRALFGDGTYKTVVQAETPLTANDSSTIDFTTSGTANHTLTGSVKISTTANNAIIANADGIYTPVITANNGTSLNGTTVELGNAVGATTAQLLNNREIPGSTFSIGVSGTGNFGLRQATPQTALHVGSGLYQGTVQTDGIILGPGKTTSWVGTRSILAGNNNSIPGTNSFSVGDNNDGILANHSIIAGRNKAYVAGNDQIATGVNTIHRSGDQNLIASTSSNIRGNRSVMFGQNHNFFSPAWLGQPSNNIMGGVDNKYITNGSGNILGRRIIGGVGESLFIGQTNIAPTLNTSPDQNIFVNEAFLIGNGIVLPNANVASIASNVVTFSGSPDLSSLVANPTRHTVVFTGLTNSVTINANVQSITNNIVVLDAGVDLSEINNQVDGVTITFTGLTNTNNNSVAYPVVSVNNTTKAVTIGGAIVNQAGVAGTAVITINYNSPREYPITAVDNVAKTITVTGVLPNQASAAGTAAIRYRNNAFVVRYNGDTTLEGDLACSVAGKGLKIKGGTNAKIGSTTLVAGTVTVANTSITANSRIIVTRTAANSSTALGQLIVTKSVGVSFTIRAAQPSSPATTETNDVSTIDYHIVEET